MSQTATSKGAPPPRRARTSPWTAFLIRRGLGLIAVMAGLAVGTFAVVRLIPGDPARAVAGPNATPEQVAAIRADLHLDQSPPHQLAGYLTDLLHGNLGHSFETKETVRSILGRTLPFTAELAGAALIAVLAIGVTAGMAVAIACRDGHRRWLNRGFLIGSSLGGSLPEYVTGTLLVLLFGISLGWLPVAGAQTTTALILPTAAVSIGPASVLARIVRRETDTVLHTDYLRTAHAKRLPPWTLYRRHVLPNLLTATLTLGGLLLAGLLGGTVVVEAVFDWPGLGSRLVHAIQVRDYPVIQGAVLIIGTLAALVTLTVDIALAIIDPRTRAGDTT